MTALTFGDGVAIATLIYYLLCLPLTLVVCYKHGAAKASGWRFLLVFSLIRIIGSAAHLAAISQGPDSTAATIAEVTASLGVSPLLLASLGLVSRLYNSVQDSSISFLATRAIRLIQVACTVALILCIVGATNGSLATLYDQTTLRVGVLIFVGVWVALVVLVLYATSAIRGKHYERPLLFALYLSLPILLVRVCYSLYACFGDRGPGSTLSDPTKAQFVSLFLATMEEMTVVLVYILAGLLLSPLPGNVVANNQPPAPLGQYV